MSSTTQELQLAPEDPALLSLLRNFDLGTWQTRDPGVPLAPGSLARYDRSRKALTQFYCHSHVMKVGLR